MDDIMEELLDVFEEWKYGETENGNRKITSNF